MASKYDEDVYENPFFTKIISEHHEHLERAAACNGILCIPKFAVSSQVPLKEADIIDHILLPTKEQRNEENDDNETETEESSDNETEDYVTISGKTVTVSSSLVIAKHGFDAQRQIPVLFSETFHTDGGECYRMFCIGGFLNKHTASTGQSAVKLVNPTSYQQCLDLLWSKPERQKVRISLDKIMAQFAASYIRLEGESLRSIVDAANSHFTKAMQFLLKDSVVRKSARHNHQYMESLKIAVETYMMNAIHRPLFGVITATMAGEDAEVNKITRNLVDLQISDLGIRNIFSQNMIPAKKELSLLNRYSTPMGRLFCIKRVVAALTKPTRENAKDRRGDTVAMMTTDDLLPILIFLIIKADTPNWMANLAYMQHFHFAKSTDDDEFGFYLASIEAALEHIRSGDIKNDTMTLKRERWNSIILQEPGESSRHPVTPSSNIEQFFKLVQLGNEEQVVQMLERPHKTSEEVQLKLCHPLCSCDRCDRLMNGLRTKSDLVTAYTRDNRGYTALHIAAYYGQGMLIDLLVKHHAIVDATDYLGLTPLHLACQRGYQNVMLLLVHFNSDPMAVDNEGNTPLHLCCANGHDDCVKALVFYDASVHKLDINAANELGDTPLHFAAKWGYESIVKTLLESGANATMLNRKKQSAVSLAQNVKVQRLLQFAAEGVDFKPFRPRMLSADGVSKLGLPLQQDNFITSYDAANVAVRQSSGSTSSGGSFVETASLEEVTHKEKHRHKERLFKAIIEGDIQLVKFYLGVGPNSSIEDDLDEEEEEVSDGLGSMSPRSLSSMCHPLCQCEKCQNVQKVSRQSHSLIDVNIRTSTGYCPVHMAVLHNHTDIIALLISLNADISAQNHKCLTPLHLACCMRNSLTTDMLIKAGAHLDVRDMNGDTPLLIASSNGFINGVHMLIKAGAKLDVTNLRGNTATHEALKRDYFDTAACLVKAGADPRIKNSQNQIALEFTEDATTQAMLMSAALALDKKEYEEGELASPEGTSRESPLFNKGSEGQISIKDLFAAFERADSDSLQELGASIRSFNRKARLKKTETIDRSQEVLAHIARTHSIMSFDKGSLKKVKSFDKTDPLYTYSLFKAACDDYDYTTGPYDHMSDISDESYVLCDDYTRDSFNCGTSDDFDVGHVATDVLRDAIVEEIKPQI